MEDKKHICKFCGKEFESGKKLGGHTVRCKLNPNSKEMYQKIGQKNTEHANFNIYDIQCPICGKYKQIKMSLNSYKNGKYAKTCSSKCAHKLTNQNTNLEEKNKNISKGMQQFVQNCTEEQYFYTFRHYRQNGPIIHICNYCGKEFNQKERGKSGFCCNECMKASRHKKLSASAKRNRFGGLNPDTTHKHYHRGYYNNIWCDSSWELAFVVYCKEHNMSIERNKQSFEYIFNNQTFKFYPDFIVNSKFIEIKGFYTPKNIAKHEQYPNIEFIDRKTIKPYIKYVSEKYGEKYWEVLYN